MGTLAIVKCKGFIYLFLCSPMHRVAEIQRAGNWELEKELEKLELFFHHPKGRSALPSSS